MNKIFNDYAEKYQFLKDLSKQQQSIIICMMHESSKSAYEEGCKITADDIINKV